MIKMSEVTRVWNPIIHDVMFSIIEHEIRVINMSTMLHYMTVLWNFLSFRCKKTYMTL